MGFWEFRVQDLGFRVQGLEFRIGGLGFSPPPSRWAAHAKVFPVLVFPVHSCLGGSNSHGPALLAPPLKLRKHAAMARLRSSHFQQPRTSLKRPAAHVPRRRPCPNHNSVRVPRACGDQSIHAQIIIPIVFQEHTVTRASMPKS